MHSHSRRHSGADPEVGLIEPALILCVTACGLFADGDPTHCLPGRPGQVDSNHMMAGALLYNHRERQSFIIGGDPFTHIITRGLGLPLENIENNEFPKDGEVGNIVRHSLSLYAAMLEAQTPTSMFVQALALIEFLASPADYQTFKEVKKVIAKYVARNATEYNAILERFLELTGKRDPDTGKIIGYRTRLVHMGERLEDIIPDRQGRLELMVELDGYIRAVIDDMTAHSDYALEDYLEYRNRFDDWKRNLSLGLIGKAERGYAVILALQGNIPDFWRELPDRPKITD